MSKGEKRLNNEHALRKCRAKYETMKPGKGKRMRHLARIHSGNLGNIV